MLPRSAVSVPPPGEARRHSPPDPVASQGTPRLPPPAGSRPCPGAGEDGRIRDPEAAGAAQLLGAPAWRGGGGDVALGGGRPHPASRIIRPPAFPGSPTPYQGKQDPCPCRVSPSGEGHTATSGNRRPRWRSIFSMEKPVFLGSSGAGGHRAELRAFPGSAPTAAAGSPTPCGAGKVGIPPRPPKPL